MMAGIGTWIYKNHMSENFFVFPSVPERQIQDERRNRKR